MHVARVGKCVRHARGQERRRVRPLRGDDHHASAHRPGGRLPGHHHLLAQPVHDALRRRAVRRGRRRQHADEHVASGQLCAEQEWRTARRRRAKAHEQLERPARRLQVRLQGVHRRRLSAHRSSALRQLLSLQLGLEWVRAGRAAHQNHARRQHLLAHSGSVCRPDRQPTRG